MKQATLWIIGGLWAMQSGFMTMYERDDQRYIQQYKDIAMREMQRTGIPASIKLAQAIQESGAGTSELSTQANNHFGIKCGSGWMGATYQIIDDEKDVFGNPIPSCFRVYNNAEQSFVEHSEFLRDPKKQYRYGFLFQLPATDYRAWAQGLVQAGYATDPRYADRLIDLIERYQLHQYDLMGTTQPPTTPTRPTTPPPPVVVTPPPVTTTYLVSNDVKYVLAQPSESLYQIAQRTGTSLNDLLKYNENFTSGNQSLRAGTRVYVQQKRNYYRGAQQYHTVATGETIFDISQLYGLKLDHLLDRNRLETGMEPAAGASVKLRGNKVSHRPALRNDAQAPVLPDSGYLDPITPNTPPINVPPTRTEESFDGPDRFKQPEEIKPTSPTPIPIPIPTPPAPPTQVNAYYTVKAGDTLWGISQQYNIGVEALKSLNKLTSNTIYVGMQLRVK